MFFQKSLIIPTLGRGLLNITEAVETFVNSTQVTKGLCNVFLHHTSASLIINENSDVKVINDLETFIGQLVEDGSHIYTHVEEGPDDMSAHIRSVLTETSLTIPVTQKSLQLGQWQGVFLWEHRLKKYDRKITITVMGDTH